MRGCRVYNGGLPPRRLSPARTESRRDHIAIAVDGRGCGSTAPDAAICDSVEGMVQHPDVEVLDIAVPPDCQVDVIQIRARHPNRLRAILAQKPLGINYGEARELVRMCEDAGIVLAVNQNMRFDQSVRACRELITTGSLGTPVRNDRHACDPTLDAMAGASGVGYAADHEYSPSGYVSILAW